MCQAGLKRDADKAGPNMVKAIPTRSLKISTIREYRNLGVSFEDAQRHEVPRTNQQASTPGSVIKKHFY
jgi:hypothetical protein